MIRTHRLRRAALCAVLGFGSAGVGGCMRESLRSQAATAPEAGAAAELAASLAAAAPRRPAAEPSTEDSAAQNLARGHREAEAGRPEQAARFYERVLREDPRNAVAHHRLAVIADQNRDFASAERHYRAALDGRPADADLLNDLGYSYLMQGRYPESERTLREAVAAAPRHERALTNLGLLYGTMGDQDRALAVLRMTGSDEEARSKLAILVPRSGDRTGVALAPPGRPAESPVLPVSATAQSLQSSDRADAAVPGDAARDLTEQLARAGGPPSAQTALGYRPSAGRLPGLIDPATANAGSREDVPQPYTRGQVQFAAKPAPADAPVAAPAYGGAPSAPGGRGTVVTANAEASMREPPDDLPLWTPPPGTVAPSPRSGVPAPAQYGAAAPSGGYGMSAAPALPRAAGGSFGPTAGPLPPPAYAAAAGGPVQAMGYGPVTGYGREIAGPPPQVAVSAGHSAPAFGTSSDLRAYADDLARLEAEAAEDRSQLEAERTVPYGSPEPAPYGGRTGTFYR